MNSFMHRRAKKMVRDRKATDDSFEDRAITYGIRSGERLIHDYRGV